LINSKSAGISSPFPGKGISIKAFVIFLFNIYALIFKVYRAATADVELLTTKNKEKI